MTATELIQRARDLLIQTNLPHIVYRRHGRLAVLPLKTYLDADLAGKGAKRVHVATRNARGEII
jgi:hypothetical protein